MIRKEEESVWRGRSQEGWGTREGESWEGVDLAMKKRDNTSD